MLRLAILSTNRFKYSETFIHMHVEHLPFEVHLLYGGYLPEFATRDLREEGRPLLAFPPRPGLTDKFRGRSPEEVKRIRLEKALGAYLRAHEIDMVLAEYGPAGVAVMDVCGKEGIPFVVHFHGYDAYRKDILSEQGKAYPEMFRKAAGVVAVSKHMEAQLRALGAPAERLHRIPYGIDTERFRPAERPALAPMLLAVGRLEPKKGPLYTLQAFARARQEVPALRLVMVGGGSLEGACREFIEAEGLEPYVTLTGPLEHAEVAGYMREATAFVQHSVTTEDGDREGLPLAVLEAGASGLPVIATRHAGIPDVIGHDGEGLLCEEGDVAEMAWHMARVATSRMLAGRLGKAAAERVKKDFSRERYLGGLAALLEKAAAGDVATLPPGT